MSYLQELQARRTFAIISHPDAGKTTLTERLLLFGGAIQMAGNVKGRKTARHATSDWMKMEKERGISVTTSVMQFLHHDKIVNLLDTPGHEDFSEDTYRTLTAVDSALMVIDCAKGVEARTIKLMEVCRLRDTPIFTFINKLDREGRDPIDLLDEVESVLHIKCAPMTWPIGMGKQFRGIYHIPNDEIILYNKNNTAKEVNQIIAGLDNPEVESILGDMAEELKDELELVLGASHAFDLEQYLAGKLSPVYFGSAINDFGIKELLDDFVEYSPPPQSRHTTTREVMPNESDFSGFVFKIQANMDQAHRDRIAFLRICSGAYYKGMKARHVRIQRDIKITEALTFMAATREHAEKAYPGDIIGLHNHGTIRIGDTFTQGEKLQFTGIPNFAPELFRRAQINDPLRTKALLKGLMQLCEEGATQLFRPRKNNDLILGAVGILQFDVVAQRLVDEYKVNCLFENISVATARWVSCEDDKILAEFIRKNHNNIADDHGQDLVYLAPTLVNLQLTIERWPKIQFRATREHGIQK